MGLHEGAMVDHTRALYEPLHTTGHQVTYSEYNGGHDYACWHVALADGLVRLLGLTDQDDPSSVPAAPSAP